MSSSDVRTPVEYKIISRESSVDAPDEDELNVYLRSLFSEVRTPLNEFQGVPTSSRHRETSRMTPVEFPECQDNESLLEDVFEVPDDFHCIQPICVHAQSSLRSSLSQQAQDDEPMKSSPVSRVDLLSSSSSLFVGLVSSPSDSASLLLSLSSFSSFFSVSSSFSSSSSIRNSSSVERHDQPSVDPQSSSRIGSSLEKPPEWISSSTTFAVPRSVPPLSQGDLYGVDETSVEVSKSQRPKCESATSQDHNSDKFEWETSGFRQPEVLLGRTRPPKRAVLGLNLDPL